MDATTAEAIATILAARSGGRPAPAACPAAPAALTGRDPQPDSVEGWADSDHAYDYWDREPQDGCAQHRLATNVASG